MGCDGFNSIFLRRYLIKLTVTELWKLVHCFWSYRENKSGLPFETRGIVIVAYTLTYNVVISLFRTSTWQEPSVPLVGICAFWIFAFWQWLLITWLRNGIESCACYWRSVSYLCIRWGLLFMNYEIWRLTQWKCWPRDLDLLTILICPYDL